MAFGDVQLKRVHAGRQLKPYLASCMHKSPDQSRTQKSGPMTSDMLGHARTLGLLEAARLEAWRRLGLQLGLERVSG